jgi:hypothetical protein
MGAGASSLTGTLNRADLLKATQNPRFLMDKILEYMLTQINEKDVFKMSDPATCSKFLILSAGALDQVFDEIDVQPATDKSGKLYFKKVATLTQPPRGGIEAQQRETNCLAIAYFYVRILQIYIALAYTILDDPRIMPGSSYRYTAGPVPMARGTPGRKLVILGGALADGYAWTLGILRQKGVFRGGVLGIQLTGHDNIILEPTGSSNTTGTIKLKNDRAVPVPPPYPGYPHPPPYPGYPVAPPYSAYYTISLTKSNVNKTPRINITSITLRPGETRRLDKFWISVDNELKEGAATGKSNYRPLEDILAEILESLQTRDYENVLAQYQHRTDEDKRGEPEAGYGVPVRNAYGRPVAASSLSPPSNPKGLQFGDSLTFLRPGQTQPLAHCIARSFQLLNIDALAGGPTKSSICSKTFKEVPRPGDPITAVKGLKAFEFLYFVLGKSVGLSSMTKEAYNVALRYMFTKFGNPGPAPTATDDTTMRFGTIKSAQVGRCGSTTGELTLDRNQTAIAKQGVAALWGYQRAHAAKVEKLFMKLFDIGQQRDGSLSIKISENLFKGGIPAVEAVANEARLLLGEYYGKCEEIYRTTASKL